MGWSAFAPKGNTVTVAVTTAASTGVQAPCSPGEAQVNYLISNATSQACFLGYGPSAATAQTMAATVSAGGLWLAPNSSQTFTFGPATFFSTIAPATTTTVYITPGDGL